MAGRKRYEGTQDWKAGFRSLRRLQRLLDDAIDGRDEVDTLLADLKLKVNEALRKNALSELQVRREQIELKEREQAIEAGRRSDAELLEAIRRAQRSADEGKVNGHSTIPDLSGLPSDETGLIHLTQDHTASSETYVPDAATETITGGDRPPSDETGRREN